MHIIYRDFSQNDQEIVTQLIKEFNNFHNHHSREENKLIKQTFQRLFANGSSLYIHVFEKDKEIIGYCLLVKYWSLECGGYILKMDEIFVKERYRGQGVASGYIQYLKSTWGSSIVSIQVEFKNNLVVGQAQRLFEKEGLNYVLIIIIYQKNNFKYLFMNHVAIMSKKHGAIAAIIKGDKTIESRWYKSKIAPYNRIQKDDWIYFKHSGGKVVARAIVNKVLQGKILSVSDMEKLYEKYAALGKINMIMSKDEFLSWVMLKKYYILIFLSKVEIIEEFNIDKTGFGNACAWLCVNNIDVIRI